MWTYTRCNNNLPKPVNVNKTSRINNIKNYLTRFDPTVIKIKNEPGFSKGRRIITATFYVNGNKAGNAAINIGPKNAKFNWGGTNPAYRGRDIGSLLRALLTKAVINVGKYNKITHFGVNNQKISNARQGGDPRPTSTWLVQEKLGFRPNKLVPLSKSEFKLGNNLSKINKILKNYKNKRS